MKINQGFSFYGQTIGVLVNASKSPRIPGDAGHNGSFSYPVRYQITGTSFGDMITGSEETKQKLISAGQALKDAGCRGILADCGLMSLYQQELAQILDIPFVGSSLIQIPLVWLMFGKKGTIGIITGHSDFLKESHLRSSGWNEAISLAIEGMQTRPHFSEIVINGGMDLHPGLMCDEVIDAAKTLKSAHPDLTAIILECSNLGTYSKAVADTVNLPVFDTISAANLLQYALCPPDYI